MTGLRNPAVDQADRILDLLDNPTQDSNEASYGGTAQDGDCWRCQRHPAATGSDSGLCDGCRTYMLGDTSHDPAARPPGRRTTVVNVGVQDVVYRTALQAGRAFQAAMEQVAATINEGSIPEHLDRLRDELERPARVDAARRTATRVAPGRTGRLRGSLHYQHPAVDISPEQAAGITDGVRRLAAASPTADEFAEGLARLGRAIGPPPDAEA